MVDLQQTQDSLEERVRQHRQLQTDFDQQAAHLTQLRAELQSSTQSSAELQNQLADQISTVSGEQMTPVDLTNIYLVVLAMLTVLCKMHGMPIASSDDCPG